MKKKETKRETIEVREVVVSRVRQAGDNVYFSVKINGVTINSCRVVEGKNGDFISFPSYKGKDGNYYDYVYAPLADDDSRAILEEVEKQLNAE